MKHFEAPEMTVRAMQIVDVLTISTTAPTTIPTTTPTTAPTTAPTTGPTSTTEPGGDIYLPPDTFA